MRRFAVLILILIVAISPSHGAKCRGRYMEMRGGDGFVTRGGCRGLDSQIQEEFWTTVGFDGALRDGRTTDDFLIFPEHENNGHRQRNSFVGYWITRSKYGDNVHYEAFGHAFIKPDGKVCGWFVGAEKEVVEVCGGFRILSRSRHNPHQPTPFEWVQGPEFRNRDVLGFHSHKIAKYQLNGDEVVFGDADVKNKKFNGVSVSNEERVQVDQPDQFHRKIWLLKKKVHHQQAPQDIRRPVIAEPKRSEDLDIYRDPHHEERITNWRRYPYYNDQSASRSAFDAAKSSPQNVEYYRDQNPNTQKNQISHNYQYYDAQQQPPRNHPGYEEWLRNQYRSRGIIPNGYEAYFANNRDDNGAIGEERGIQKNSGRDEGNRGISVVDGNGQEINSNSQYEQPAYIIQQSSVNNENTQAVYADRNGNGNVGSVSSDDGKTYYSVNPGEPVNAAQSQVDGEFEQYKASGEEKNDDADSDSRNVVVPKNEDSQSHVRFIRYHPPTVVRDKKGNQYERRVENGNVHYFDASGNEVKTKIDDSTIDQKIEKILEKRRRQEELMRDLVGKPPSDESNPISTAQVARQGSNLH